MCQALESILLGLTRRGRHYYPSSTPHLTAEETETSRDYKLSNVTHLINGKDEIKARQPNVSAFNYIPLEDCATVGNTDTTLLGAKAQTDESVGCSQFPK